MILSPLVSKHKSKIGLSVLLYTPKGTREEGAISSLARSLVTTVSDVLKMLSVSKESLSFDSIEDTVEAFSESYLEGILPVYITVKDFLIVLKETSC